VSQPDLFVVCRNCGSEVSPYVTECPYCGQRIRKRAPKIERDAEGVRPKQRRRPRLSRLRPDEIVGIAPDGRPVATMLLIGLSLAVTLALATGQVALNEVGGIWLPLDDDPWRYATSMFVFDNLAYQFVALVAVGVDLSPPFADLNVGYWILGANGAALGLLCAWLVDDRRAARRGADRGNDLIGVAVFAIVLLAISLAVPEASLVAGVVGAAAGALLGLALPVVSRR
jgi:membrane associated rhomboid family serine protease